MKFEYKKRSLYMFENGIRKLLAEDVSNKYFVKEDMTAIFYLTNSFQWDMGDLHLKKKGYDDKLIDEKVRIIEISNKLNRVTYLKNYEHSSTSENYLTGDLCILENLEEKKFIDSNVYIGSLILENKDDSYRVFYTKKSKENSELYEMYMLDKDDKKIFIDEYSLGQIALYRDESDKMIIKYFKPYLQEDYEKKGDIRLYKEDGNMRSILQKETSIYDASKEIENREDIFKYEDINNEYKSKIIGKEILNVSEDDSYRIYYRKSISKKYYIGREISSRAMEHKVLNNIFLDDDSENNIAVFAENQVRDIFLAYNTMMPFIYQDSGITGYDIYGVEVNEILKACENFKGYNMNYRQSYNHNSYMLKDSNFKIHAEQVRDYLMKSLNISSKNILSKIIMNDIIKPIRKEHERCSKLIEESNIRDEIDMKEEKRKIEERLTMENRLPTKWKSEQQMFKLIKKYFPTAQMHSRPDWLKPQHIDVFLPEQLIAFEYQGKQHYSPVDFFGGEDSFVRRIELDKRKKRLCKENNVILIEWIFNEPVTLSNLKKKLNTIGIKL